MKRTPIAVPHSTRAMSLGALFALWALGLWAMICQAAGTLPY